MDIVQQAIEAFQTLEPQIKLEVSSDEIAERNLALLEKLRNKCTAALLSDIQLASTRHVESRLWDVHQRLNASFRSALHKLKENGGKTIVERRKVSAEYLRFIKSAQRFYRGYISDLSLTYGGIPKLEEVAVKLNRQAGDKNRPAVSRAIEELVLASCHRTLIQLGDLSRYREAELSNKRADYLPAIGFYDLARVISPSSGIAYNQLAVVALAEGDLLRAVYYLYRSLATNEPHPQAEGNLRKAFFKISAAWDKENQPEDSKSNKQDLEQRSLLTISLRLVSRCYHGRHVPEFFDLEHQALIHLDTQIRKPEFDEALNRLILTVIAACGNIQEKFESQGGSEDSAQAFIYFLRLNINFFNVLFRPISEYLASAISTDSSELAVAQMPLHALNILPLLGIYSTWLLKNKVVMTNDVDPSVDESRKDFWTNYAQLLSVTAAHFPADSLPNRKFLIDEDVETLGFRPLICDATMNVWYDNGTIKPTAKDLESKQNNIIFALSRIRKILEQGLVLSLDESTPLMFDEATFSFRVGEVMNSFEYHSSGRLTSEALSSIKNRDANQATAISRSDNVKCKEAPLDQINLSRDQEDEAERMVSRLVSNSTEQDETSRIDHANVDQGWNVTLKDLHINASPSQNARASLSFSGQNSPDISNRPRSKPSRTSLTSRNSDALSISRPDTSNPDLSPARTLNSPRSNFPTALGTENPKQSAIFPRLLGATHTRTYSNESVRSMSSIWSPGQETWSTFRQTPGGSGLSPSGSAVRLGNGTFGLLDTDQNRPVDAAAMEHARGAAMWDMASSQAEQRFRSSPNVVRGRSSV